jgi:hypothetical protein
VKTVLEKHFGNLCAGSLEIGQLVLAVEPEPNAPFIVHSSHRFMARNELRIA